MSSVMAMLSKHQPIDPLKVAVVLNSYFKSTSTEQKLLLSLRDLFFFFFLMLTILLWKFKMTAVVSVDCGRR